MAFALFLLAGNACAATIAVVLSDNTPFYQETADAIESGLGRDHTIVRIQVSHLGQSESALNNARIIVTIGVKASSNVAQRRGRTPILAVMVPRSWHEEVGKSLLSEGGRMNGTIFIDQPLSRQFHLIKSALPSVTKVGVVLGKETVGRLAELDRQAKAHRVNLVSASLDSNSRLVETIERVLDEAEVLLLAFPDAEVLSRTTAQSVFMTSYRFRDPVVGYSQSLSRAGALLAVYSTPAQIGRQTSEVLSSYLDRDKMSAVHWPQYFSVSVNEHVARSLDIMVPSEQVLLKRVQDAESHD
ncbi:MAG: hypothetical protein HXY27_03595 [Hydrogenophilaceae bacterium]|jgi:ABC-type uncharacterized transport system substrate-binding protein|nr:hypothetical protein [Hydrogenophilaceae bacterium]